MQDYIPKFEIVRQTENKFVEQTWQDRLAFGKEEGHWETFILLGELSIEFTEEVPKQLLEECRNQLTPFIGSVYSEKNTDKLIENVLISFLRSVADSKRLVKHPGGEWVFM